MDYDNLSDHEREQFAAVSINHLSREIHTLVEIRGRVSAARRILETSQAAAYDEHHCCIECGRHQARGHETTCRVPLRGDNAAAVRAALLALQGAPIDQIMQEATPPDRAE